MKVDREKLLHALTLTEHGLSQRDVVEQSGCYVFQEGRIITFNDEIACSCETDLKINGAVQAEPFKNILAKLKEEFLEINEEDTQVLIKGKGSKRIGIVKESQIHMPIAKLEVPKKWKDLPNDFSEAIEFVQGCAGRDEAEFTLTCIHIHPKFIEAFDNFQFARYNIKLDLKSEFLVRQASIKAIITMGMGKISEGKNWVHFKNDDGVTLSCRRWKDDYLDCSFIVKANGEKVTLPKGLIESSNRAEVFSENNAQQGNIKVDLSKDQVILKGEGSYGWYSEKKKIEYTGKSYSFMIRPSMLVQLLQRENRCIISEKLLKVQSSENKAVYVTSLMPALDSKPKNKGKKKGKKK